MKIIQQLAIFVILLSITLSVGATSKNKNESSCGPRRDIIMMLDYMRKNNVSHWIPYQTAVLNLRACVQEQRKSYKIELGAIDTEIIYYIYPNSDGYEVHLSFDFYDKFRTNKDAKIEKQIKQIVKYNSEYLLISSFDSSILSESYLNPIPTFLKHVKEGFPHYYDVDLDHGNYAAISFLTNRRVLNGYSNGNFLPSKSINRAEVIKIITNEQGVSLDVLKYSNCFSDVSTQWFAPAICYAKDNGWIGGYSDGSFRPSQTISNAESLKILLEAYSIDIAPAKEYLFNDVDEDDWFFKYIAYAKKNNLLVENGDNFFPNWGQSRGGFSEMLFQLLRQDL